MVSALNADTLEEALEIRAFQKVIPFAGGTDLMVRKKSWAGTLPAFDLPVLFIGNLDALKGCRSEDGTLRIGAAEKLADITGNPAVPEILRLAVKEMASPSIRSMGTIGGNIMNASPAGDTLPALCALDATVTVQSTAGSRELPIGQFILGPGKTALNGDELLINVNIQVRDYSRAYYRKVGTRKADALSKVSFAGLADIKDGRVETLRIAVGAVAPTVVRSEEAEGMLEGKTAREIPALLPEILEIYARLIRPIDDQRSSAEYRKKVSLKLIEDFIKSVIM